MKHTQRRNLLRDVAWLLLTPLATRQGSWFDYFVSKRKPTGNLARTDQEQTACLRPRIAAPTQSVMRRV
jgi:hypothetical protein